MTSQSDTSDESYPLEPSRQWRLVDFRGFSRSASQYSNNDRSHSQNRLDIPTVPRSRGPGGPRGPRGPPDSHDQRGRPMWKRPSDNADVYLYCCLPMCCRSLNWRSIGSLVSHISQVTGRGKINDSNALEICSVTPQERCAGARPQLNPTAPISDWTQRCLIYEDIIDDADQEEDKDEAMGNQS